MYPFDLPYVVKIYNATYPCGKETQEVFTFRHLPYPSDPTLKDLPQGENQSLKKFTQQTFIVKDEQTEIHGFAGYFTAELYQKIFYSIEPSVHTPTMHSWFPLYFPIRTPFLARKG